MQDSSTTASASLSAPARQATATTRRRTDDLHAGELAKAQSGAEHGIAVASLRGELLNQWKFRLLRCEILLYGGRAGEVLNQLRDAVPAAPEFAALAARRLRLDRKSTRLNSS